MTLCGTPPWVHFQVTLPPFLIDTDPGENELFLTETVLVDPAWAGTTATAVASDAATAATESLRSMGGLLLKGWLDYQAGRRRGRALFPRQRVALVGADGAGRRELAGDQVALDRAIGARAVDRGLRVAGALDRQQPRRAERALDALRALVGGRRVEAAVDQQQRRGRLAVERAGVAIGVAAGQVAQACEMYAQDAPK